LNSLSAHIKKCQGKSMSALCLFGGKAFLVRGQDQFEGLEGGKRRRGRELVGQDCFVHDMVSSVFRGDRKSGGDLLKRFHRRVI